MLALHVVDGWRTVCVCVWLCLGPAQQQQQQREAGQQQQMEGAVLLRGGCRAVQVVAESVFQQQMGVRADACQERGERERLSHGLIEHGLSSIVFFFVCVLFTSSHLSMHFCCVCKPQQCKCYPCKCCFA